jgi:hypothetical protein
VLRQRRITARIARKGIGSSTRLGRHRYVIERCLEWVSRFRRLPAATNAWPPLRRFPASNLRSDLLPPRRAQIDLLTCNSSR